MATFLSVSTVLLFCTLLLFGIHPSTNASNDEPTQERLDAFWESFSTIASTRNRRLNGIAKRIAQIGLELNQSSSACYESIQRTLSQGLAQPWSTKMINSNRFFTSDPISRLLSEETSSLGDFDDCLTVANVPIEGSAPSSKQQFSGMYCLVSVDSPPLSVQVNQTNANQTASDHLQVIARKWLLAENGIQYLQGICAPSLCSSEQLTTLIRKYLADHLRGMKLTILYCQQRNGTQAPTMPFLLARMLAIGMITLVLVSNCVYLLLKKARFNLVCNLPTYQRIIGFVKCFSITHNIGRLFSEPVNVEEAHDLRFLYGLRALMITGSVFVHSHTFLSVYLLSRVSIFQKERSFFEQYKMNHPLRYNFLYRSFLLVDIFFVLSGFLASYKVFRSQAKRAPHFVSYVFEHWLRLVPLMCAILCMTILAQRSGSGALFHETITDPYVKPCVEYWWTHLLLINNWWTLDKMLHILLFGSLWLYYRRPNWSVIFAVSLTVLSLSLYLVFSFISLPAIPLLADFRMSVHSPPLPLTSIRLFYTSPQSHILAYFTGALISMRVLSRKKEISKLPSLWMALFALTFISGTMLPIGGPESQDSSSQGVLSVAIFLCYFVIIVLSQSAFFYFLIIQRRKSLFKRLLSSRFLAPIGRLSFAIYLLNPLANWHNLHQTRQTVPLTLNHMRNMFFIDYCRTIFWALILYLFVQAPIQNIRHLAMNGKQDKAIAATRGEVAELKLTINNNIKV